MAAGRYVRGESFQDLASKAIDQWDGNDVRALVERAVANGVLAEKLRWMQTFGYDPNAPCACIGCPHEVNCFCDCPTCMVADSLRYKRELWTKLAVIEPRAETSHQKHQQPRHGHDSA